MKWLKLFENFDDVESVIKDFIDSEFDSNIKVVPGGLHADQVDGKCPKCGSTNTIFALSNIDYYYNCKDCGFRATYFDVIGWRFIPHYYNGNGPNRFPIWMTQDDHSPDRFSSLSELNSEQISRLNHILEPFDLRYYLVENTKISSFIGSQSILKDITKKYVGEGEEILTKFIQK